MTKFKHFVGIDVSKEKLDAALLLSNHKTSIYCGELPNTVKGVGTLLKQLKEQKISLKDVLFCMEDTGLYSSVLTATLWKKGLQVWVQSPYAIKQSTGIQRGKTDKIDALKIAKYAARFSDKAILYQPISENLVTIGALLSMRKKLIKYRNGLKTHLQELKQFNKAAYKEMRLSINTTIAKMQKEQAVLDAKIDQLVQQDKQLLEVQRLATSVPGVGKVTVWHLICATALFTKCKSAKQLACYCGVVPFEYTSGKSVQKRARTHYMANKEIKSLLQMCAMSAIQHDPQIKAYYERKVAEGKNKMLVQNNVRNKLVHRIYAVVSNRRPFVKVAA